MTKRPAPEAATHKNFLWLLAGRVLSDVCLFLFYVALSRRFGEVGIGHYAFAMSLTGVFGFFVDFGLHRYSLRYWATDPQAFSARLSEVLALRLTLLPIGFVLIAATILLLEADGPRGLVLLIVGTHQLLFTLANGWLAVYVAHHKSRLAGTLDLAAKALTLALGASLMFAGAELAVVLISMPAATICLILVVAIKVRREFGVARLTAGFEALGSTVRSAWPAFLSVIGRQLAIRMDVVLLGLITGAAATGLYSVGQRLVWMLMAIPALAAVAILPRASALYDADRGKLLELYRRSLNVTILISVPASAGICLLADDIIALIFGARFEQAVPVLRILSLFLLLSAIRNVLGLFLTACDREASRARLEWVGAAIGLGAEWFLIVRHGMIGAAVGVVLMEAVTTLMTAVLVSHELGIPRIWLRLAMACVGTASFVLVFLMLGEPPLYATVPLAAVIYAAVVMLSPAILRDEFSGLVSLAKRPADL